MKFVCLIYAYKDPNQLKRTINALGDLDIYVHVDLKKDINSFKSIISSKENVYWIDNRVFVCWGGYTQVDVLKEFMRCVDRSGKTYDRVLSLSAMDYPTLSASDLSDYFARNPEKNYCTSLNITKEGNKKAIEKVQKYWFYDIKIKNFQQMRIVRKLVNCIADGFYRIGLARKKPYLSVEKENWDIYFSTDYWCLTFDAFQYVYRQLSDNPQIEKYFKHAFAPSELITATILSNSEFYNTIDHISWNEYNGLGSVTPLHFIEYDETNGSGMKILTEEDYERIIHSGRPFCRKVSSDASNILEDMIDLRKDSI